MILNDPHLTARQLASWLDIVIGNTHTLLLTKFSGLSCVCSWWILYLLSPPQKNIHVEMCQYLIWQVANDADYLNNVITANKMWIYFYSPVFKQQTRKWVARSFSHLLTPHAKKSKIKCMVFTLFNQEGQVYTHTHTHTHTHNARWSNSQWGFVCQNPKASYYGAYPM